jgi:outer membrane biosynthesis protein TonB
VRWLGQPEGVEMQLSVRLLAETLLILSLPACGVAAAQSPPNAPNPPKPSFDLRKALPASGVEILSDTLGVDFKPYLAKIMPLTQHSWNARMPNEVSDPNRKTSAVKIRFSILRDGHVEPKSMVLVGSSGDVALDKAAWYAISYTVYPPLPEEFKGPRLIADFNFIYNSPHPPAAAATR